jgi:L-fucono-1,5-lactonase
MPFDAHQHFWEFDPAQYSWIQPDWPIRREFLPDDLSPVLSGSGIEGSIAVQARQTLEETRWLLDLAEQHSFIKGVVGWVDLRSDAVEEQLSTLSKDPKLVGVRHVVQDEPDDRFMLDPKFMRGISMLARFHLTYDILITPRQLPAAIELAKSFPKQAFVVDHLAKPLIRQGTLSPWREQISELAKSRNVFCKVSGMVTEADWALWKPADFAPYLEVVLAAFGTDRLMFGSDWPVCLLAAPYQRVFSLVEDWLAHLKPTQRQRIFGENCERFYLRRK